MEANSCDQAVKKPDKYPLLSPTLRKIIVLACTLSIPHRNVKKSVHFCQYTKTCLEIKFLMHDSVASAAPGWRVLANDFWVGLSGHAKSIINLCGIYQRNIFDVIVIMIMTMIIHVIMITTSIYYIYLKKSGSLSAMYLFLISESWIFLCLCSYPGSRYPVLSNWLVLSCCIDGCHTLMLQKN